MFFFFHQHNIQLIIKPLCTYRSFGTTGDPGAGFLAFAVAALLLHLTDNVLPFTALFTFLAVPILLLLDLVLPFSLSDVLATLRMDALLVDKLLDVSSGVLLK